MGYFLTFMPHPRKQSLLGVYIGITLIKPCLGCNLFMLTWISIILYTIVVHDPKVCHDLGLILYLSKVKVTMHTYIVKFVSGLYFLLVTWIWMILHTIVVLDQMCVMILTLGLTCISKIKVHINWHNSQTLCQDYNISLVTWIGMILHTTVVHKSRVCHGIGTRSYLRGYGYNARIAKIHVHALTFHR